MQNRPVEPASTAVAHEVEERWERTAEEGKRFLRELIDALL